MRPRNVAFDTWVPQRHPGGPQGGAQAVSTDLDSILGGRFWVIFDARIDDNSIQNQVPKKERSRTVFSSMLVSLGEAHPLKNVVYTMEINDFSFFSLSAPERALAVKKDEK